MKAIISILAMVLVSVVLLGCAQKQEDTVADYGTIIGTMIDGKTGNPVPGRVYAVGSDDSIYMAEKCIPYDRPNFGTRIGYSGRHFTTIGNTFTVHLPPGSATINIERGKECVPVKETIFISPGQTITKEFVLNSWIDMASKGWYSGDLHVHRSLDELADLLITEDLNVAIPQTNWSSHGTDEELEEWLEKADSDGTIAVDDHHIFSVLSNEIERFSISALLLHHTGKTVLPVKRYLDQGLPNNPLLEMTRDAGGYIDVEKPMWPESHIDVAVGKADFIGIANNHNTYKSYLPEHPRFRTEFRDDYPDGEQGYVEYVCDLYYAFLNCGFKVMPSAGSASGVLPNPLGYNRVYARVDGEFTYDKWFTELKAGRSFATNGPMLIMTVDNKEMGETVTVQDHDVHSAHVVCTVYSLRLIDRIEIIRDGEIVETAKPQLSDYSAVVETNIPFSASGWIAARCFEQGGKVRFAHTSPLFINITTKPFKPKASAAEYFLRKTNEVIAQIGDTYSTSEEGEKAALIIFKKAAKLYEKLIEQSK